LANPSASEFRPYLRTLQATLASVAILAILYLLTSIAWSVFRRGQVRLRRAPIQAGNIDDLLQCQAEVERLFQEMNDRTFDLHALAAHKESDLAQQWEVFSQRWRGDWAEVDARCRFEELRDRGLGTAFDRLAYAHEALHTLQLKFASGLKNYIDNEAPQIEGIRRGLAEARTGLEKQKRAQAQKARQKPEPHDGAERGP
jgi:hypothetical protein